MPKGDRLPRLLRMITTIQNRPGLTAEELAGECGISTRQFFRDIKVLDYAGLPLQSENGYRFMSNVLLQNISFSLDEALSLLYGLKLMERQKALFPMKRVKERLLSLLPAGLRDGIENLDPRVDMVQGQAAADTGKAELFRLLNQAMRELRRIEIDYYCFSRDEKNLRQVNPYHIVYKDGFWYLVAFCHLRGEKRLFRVDRIKHIHLMEARFDPPLEAVLTSPLESAWGIELGEEFLFSVRFWGNSARFVLETHFHPSQVIVEEPEESLVFSARACGIKSVARWVLSFGGEAEVLEPKELRNMVTDQVKSALDRYE